MTTPSREQNGGALAQHADAEGRLDPTAWEGAEDTDPAIPRSSVSEEDLLSDPRSWVT